MRKTFRIGKPKGYMEKSLNPEDMQKFIEMTFNTILMISDYEYHLKFFNDTFTQLLGWTEEDCLGRNMITEFVFEEDRQKTMDVISQVIEKKANKNHVNRLICKDGSLRLIEWKARANSTNKRIYYMGNDITMLVNAEIGIEKISTRLDNLIRLVPIGLHFYILNEDGNLIFEGTNPEGNMLIPIAESDLGRTIEEVFPPLKEAGVIEHYKKIAFGGGVMTFPKIRYKRGDFFGIYEIKVFRCGERRIAVLFHDITQLEMNEEKRQIIESSIQQNQRLESMGILAGGFAHDFNNLLQAVLQNLDFAIFCDDNIEDMKNSINLAKDAVLKAAKLSKQILVYSGRGMVTKSKYSLNQIIEDFYILLQTTVSKKNQLVINMGNGLPDIYGNADQIQQILLNLIVNASESIASFRDSGGVITLSTYLTKREEPVPMVGNFNLKIEFTRYVVMDVKDNGKGINKKIRERLFEPFNSDKEFGRGMGLASIYGIVKDHRGYIEVESEEGEGASFRILFPLAEDIAKD